MTEIKAYTAAGAPIITAPDFQTIGEARAWANRNREYWPGCYIESVERIEYRRRIWTDRTETKGEREAA